MTGEKLLEIWNNVEHIYVNKPNEKDYKKGAYIEYKGKMNIEGTMVEVAVLNDGQKIINEHNLRVLLTVVDREDLMEFFKL